MLRLRVDGGSEYCLFMRLSTLLTVEGLGDSWPCHFQHMLSARLLRMACLRTVAAALCLVTRAAESWRPWGLTSVRACSSCRSSRMTTEDFGTICRCCSRSLEGCGWGREGSADCRRGALQGLPGMSVGCGCAVDSPRVWMCGLRGTPHGRRAAPVSRRQVEGVCTKHWLSQLPAPLFTAEDLEDFWPADVAAQGSSSTRPEDLLIISPQSAALVRV